MELHGGLVSIAMESRPLFDHYQTIQERGSLLIGDGPHAMRDEARKVLRGRQSKMRPRTLGWMKRRSVSHQRIFRKHGTI